MARESKKIKIGIIVAFFLFILAYGFYRSSDLMFGVDIDNVNVNGLPGESGMVMRESVMKIHGNAKHAVTLTLNGREISIDLEGNFEETIALLPGYNTVTLEATDKFGYVDRKNYQLIYSPL